jgi:hypothetical protein
MKILELDTGGATTNAVKGISIRRPAEAENWSGLLQVRLNLEGEGR